VRRAEPIALLAAAGAMVFVGSSFAASDALADHPLAEGQGLRYALSVALLLAVARGRLPRVSAGGALRLAALAATGLVGFNAFLIAALRSSDPAAVGVVVGTVPVVLAVAGPLLEDRAVRPRVLGAAVAVAAGAGGVQWAGGSLTVAGLAFALATLACEAAFSLLAVPLLGSLGPLGVSTWACLMAVPAFAVWAAADGELAAPPAGTAWAIVYLGAVTPAAFLAWYTAVARLGVERAGLFAGLMPVSALLAAAALGAAELTAVRVLGAIVVGAGVAVGTSTRTPRTRPRDRPRVRWRPALPPRSPR
jgi:drug/metabolite transporter (DMT)-like permease